MRATYQALRVLHTFGDGKSALCGSEIARVTEIGPGTLYPLLARLERGGIFKAVPFKDYDASKKLTKGADIKMEFSM